MQFIELAEKRYSARRYRAEPVDRKDLDVCIEAARIAPSASNSQPWRFIVVDDPAKIQKIGNAARLKPSSMNRFVAEAPAIVVLTIKRTNIVLSIGKRIKGLDYSLIDAGIAAAHICLQASELGLGTCMIGWFDATAIGALLDIPRSIRIALLITVGRVEADAQSRRVRNALEDIRSFNMF